MMVHISSFTDAAPVAEPHRSLRGRRNSCESEATDRDDCGQQVTWPLPITQLPQCGIHREAVIKHNGSGYDSVKQIYNVTQRAVRLWLLSVCWCGVIGLVYLSQPVSNGPWAVLSQCLWYSLRRHFMYVDEKQMWPAPLSKFRKPDVNFKTEFIHGVFNCWNYGYCFILQVIYKYLKYTFVKWFSVSFGTVLNVTIRVLLKIKWPIGEVCKMVK